MRVLFFILVAALAGYGGYYLTKHEDEWIGYVPFIHKDGKPAYTEQKETFAWKVFQRTGDGPYTVRVLLIDGNRWRVESRKEGSSKIDVAVCDGSKTVASPPTGSVSSLDPRPVVNQMLAAAASISDVSQVKSPDTTEDRDGHTCWKSDVTFGGMAVQFWVDSSSGLPVCFNGSVIGIHVDFHISQLQVDFAKRGAEFFDTGHTEPLFTDDLDEALNKTEIASFTHDKTPDASKQAASTPAPGASTEPTPVPQYHYYLKEAVSLNNFYGTMTIPAKTEVRILRQTGNVCHVAAGGMEFDVQDDQILSARQ